MTEGVCTLSEKNMIDNTPAAPLYFSNGNTKLRIYGKTMVASSMGRGKALRRQFFSAVFRADLYTLDTRVHTVSELFFQLRASVVFPRHGDRTASRAKEARAIDPLCTGSSSFYRDCYECQVRAEDREQ
jgi:hypothetical protein